MASHHRLGRGLQGYLHFVTNLVVQQPSAQDLIIGANFWSLPRSFLRGQD